MKTVTPWQREQLIEPARVSSGIADDVFAGLLAEFGVDRVEDLAARDAEDFVRQVCRRGPQPIDHRIPRVDAGRVLS